MPCRCSITSSPHLKGWTLIEGRGGRIRLENIRSRFAPALVIGTIGTKGEVANPFVPMHDDNLSLRHPNRVRRLRKCRNERQVDDQLPVLPPNPVREGRPRRIVAHDKSDRPRLLIQGRQHRTGFFREPILRHRVRRLIRTHGDIKYPVKETSKKGGGIREYNLLLAVVPTLRWF